MSKTFLASVQRHERILLTGHENPDGDCIGAEVALFHLLRALGKEVEIRNPDPVARPLDFLAEHTPIGHQKGDAGVDADLVILLDCSSVGRLGRLAGPVRAARPTLAVIDHHVGSEDGDGSFALVDSTSPATGELVHRLYDAAGVPLGPEAAEGVFVSLVSDTGWFRYSNTTADVLSIAGALVRAGVDASRVYDRIHRRNEPESVAFLTDTLRRHRIELDGRYAHVSIPQGDLEKAREMGFDLDGVMEPLRSIGGVEVVAMFKDLSDGRVKLSLRAVGDVDVQAIAVELGGGGHKKAAGATISLPISKARERVFQLVRTGIERLGAAPDASAP